MYKLSILIPTINRKDLLREALLPLDQQLDQFDRLLIVDNGNQNISEIVIDLNMFKASKIDVHTMKRNTGVSASWNYGINYFKDTADAILVLNDDVVLANDQLSKINSIPTNYGWLITGAFLWSVFLIRKECWEFFLNKDGYVFDENFFPAYFEDNDMAYRLILAKEEIGSSVALHAGSRELDPVVQRNSMSIKKNPSLNTKFSKNERYYRQKWGGKPQQELYKKPFNR